MAHLTHRLALVLIFALVSPPAAACQCVGHDLEQLFLEHDHVFAITVTNVGTVSVENAAQGQTQKAEFAVLELLKGSAEGFTHIWASTNFPEYHRAEPHVQTSCDTSGVHAGASYLVFAHSGERLAYSMCGHTVQWLSYSAEELRGLANRTDADATRGSASDPRGESESKEQQADGKIDDYLRRLMRVMKESATEQDVDRLLEMYAPNAVYEHPRIGARIESVARIRAGMIAFLGKTRRPEIRIRNRIVASDVIVLRLEIMFEALIEDRWRTNLRTQVTTLEFKDGLIHRVIDYW